MKTVSKSASNPSVGRLILGIALAAVAVVPVGHADSIWPTNSAGTHSMFADRKAAAKGDILTIEIAESAVASSSQSTKSSRASTINDAVGQFIYPGLGSHKGALPALTATGNTSYSGGGDISNSQSVSARAAVLVTDVLPNGNLVIEGVRVVRFSGETQYVVLHGLVRPDDIGRDDTVQSTNIANARVEFYSDGALTDAQKRGWLAKIYEKLRPI